MQFHLPFPPLAKKRHRSKRTSKGIHTYDVQAEDKSFDRWYFEKEMREKGYQKLCNCVLHVTMTLGIPYPKSMAQKRRKGQFVKTRPDLDNYVKYYFDVMNQIVWDDDACVVSLSAQKKYADDPFIGIQIFSMEDEMVNEHAKTVKGELTLDDLTYMIQKANKLGKSGRDVLRVFAEEDKEGKHYYFGTEPLCYPK